MAILTDPSVGDNGRERGEPGEGMGQTAERSTGGDDGAATGRDAGTDRDAEADRDLGAGRSAAADREVVVDGCTGYDGSGTAPRARVGKTRPRVDGPPHSGRMPGIRTVTA